MKDLLNFRRYRLQNGLRVLLLEDHTLPMVSYQVHFQAGSRNERPGITGISHLFEHMMFRGTTRLGPEEFSKIIQARGGIVNAFTTQDHTTYWENIPSEELELVIELEAHRLKELRITEESLRTEREVVRSERKMRIATTPYGAAVEELYALAYLRHPYRWPIIGWDHDLKRLTLEECLRYFRLRYAPNNAVIVVAGDIDPQRTLALIEKHYGDI
ncbi:MAG: insulinase family protein, partial [Deltaproteobacteria bacterium]